MISASLPPSLSAANRFWFFFFFLIKDLFFVTAEADTLEYWGAQSFNQIGENYHSATTLCVVTTGIQQKYCQNFCNCGPQHTDPPCYWTILLEKPAVNSELPLRSLAVRRAVATLKHLSSWDEQILQPWAIHLGFPRKRECQTPAQEACQKAASWAQSVSHWSRVRGEVWDKEWRHLSYWLHRRADRPEMAPSCLFLSSLHTRFRPHAS